MEQHHVIGEGNDLFPYRLQRSPPPSLPLKPQGLNWLLLRGKQMRKLDFTSFFFFSFSWFLRHWVFLESRESTESHQSQHQLGVAFSWRLESHVELRLMQKGFSFFFFSPHSKMQVMNWTLQQILSLFVYGDKVTLQFSNKFASVCVCVHHLLFSVEFWTLFQCFCTESLKC